MFNVISITIGVLGLLVGLWGIILSKSSNKRAQQAEKARRSITWEDICTASNNLAVEIKAKYSPDVIYIPNIKSGIMVQFIKDYFEGYIPVIVGQAIQKVACSEQEEKRIKEEEKRIKDIDNYWKVDTSKWSAYIPKSLLKYKNEKILILDNLVLTGDFLQKISSALIDNGIDKENIISACIATTEAAIEDNTAPAFYWRPLQFSNVYMPWGK